MAMQATNRYLAAARILVDNPLSATLFALNHAVGRERKHRIRFGDIELYVRSNTPDLTVVRACLLGEFEEAMAETTDDARLIIDGGGYIGLVSILFARRFPAAQIVCLEPSSENFELARENCRPYSNIDVLNIALGASSGDATLKDRGTGQWGFTITDLGDGHGLELGKVKVVTIPQLLEHYSAARIDLLKLDIEGAEYELLEDAPAWINLCSVLFIELHEKIRPGVESLYARAIHGRRQVTGCAEKHLTVGN